MKLVADSVAGKVLGVHALADGAGEIMLAATYATRAGMTVDDLADTWAPYLTMSESLCIAAGLFRNQICRRQTAPETRGPSQRAATRLDRVGGSRVRGGVCVGLVRVRMLRR
ncbi:hypothetical protein [Dietzia kunjamensis]|uniref:hypothetical protein n=1 Tax=Dietzia kunjamensis TaxID=322509 RepID=UPI0039E7A107